MISGKQFFELTNEDESLWSVLVEKSLRHTDDGDGRVISVQPRKDLPLLIIIQFTNESEPGKFTPEAFKFDWLTNVDISMAQIDEHKQKQQQECVDLCRKHLARVKVDHLYYITEMENLPSLFTHGILPKNEVAKRGLTSKSFANPDVQKRRERKNVAMSDNVTRNLHDIVPLYIVSSTPTISAIWSNARLAIIEISTAVVCENPYAFSDGNAASGATRFFSSLNDLDEIPHDVLDAQDWKEIHDGKRQRSAEFLIYPKIDASYFTRLFVINDIAERKCMQLKTEHGFPAPIEVNQHMFFGY